MAKPHLHNFETTQSISLWEGKRRCGDENRACEMWPVRANCCCFFHIFTSSTSLFFTFLCIYLPCFNFFLSFSPKSHEILQAFTFQLWSYTVITSIWCILIFCGPYWWSLNLKFHDDVHGHDERIIWRLAQFWKSYGAWPIIMNQYGAWPSYLHHTPSIRLMIREKSDDERRSPLEMCLRRLIVLIL